MTCTPWVPPTPAQFQTQFFRDFAYAPSEIFNNNPPPAEGLRKWVFGLDVQNAINLANADFNSGLFGTNATMIFLYLAAHYLIENLRASSMGLNSQAQFVLDSSSVGSVSIANNISEMVTANPNLAKYLRTKHGQIYLDLAFPYTIGSGIGISQGTITNA